MKISFFLMFALVLSGCASISKDECRNIDWYKLGFSDGQQSHLPARVASYEKDCIKHGVLANREEYERGRMAATQKDVEIYRAEKDKSLAKSRRTSNGQSTMRGKNLLKSQKNN